jgi:hypothetical protein
MIVRCWCGWRRRPLPAGPAVATWDVPGARAVACGNGAEYARPGKLVSNGAFTLDDWVIGSHVVLRRNPHYWNDAATRLEQVHFVHIADAGTELRQYRAGQLDYTYVVPAPQFQWIKQNLPDELHVAPQLSVYYYGFNLSRPPFKDNPKLRRALSMAIDRDRLTTAVTGVGEAPAYGWVPRGVWNYTPQQFDYASRPYADRLAEARRLYAEAGYSADNRCRSSCATTRATSTTGWPSRWRPCGRRPWASRRPSMPRNSGRCCKACRPARTRRCSGRAGSAISTMPTPSRSCSSRVRPEPDRLFQPALRRPAGRGRAGGRPGQRRARSRRPSA